MNDVLKSVMKARKSGVPTEQAALRALFSKDGAILTSVTAPDATTKEQVSTWLTGKSIHIPARNKGYPGYHTIIVMLPVQHMEALVSQHSTVTLDAEGYAGEGLGPDRARWPERSRNFEDYVVGVALGNIAPPDPDQQTGDDGGRGGATGESHTSIPWNTGLRERLEAHGVTTNWQNSAGSTQPIKVGIIDWGFYGLNNAPLLDDLSIYDARKNRYGNAYCQTVSRSIYDRGTALEILSPDCQPTFGSSFLDAGIKINHGVNIAELVKDIAPDAVLSYAQANSPRQVYDAALWLRDIRNVDVIVHAGGWPYDGRGDGTSPLSTQLYRNTSTHSGGNQHSPYRYYPSPHSSVKTATDANIIWVNAAGNRELTTIRMTGLTTISSGDYADFIILNRRVTGTGREADENKTCQLVPRGVGRPYLYSLRWADSWTSPQSSLDFFVSTKTQHPVRHAADTFVNTGTREQQLPSAYPVRRASKTNTGLDLFANNDRMCLRIKVNANSQGQKRIPNWFQFQMMTDDQGETIDWNTGIDVDGHSIVNPSDSDDPGMLAVAARNMRAEHDGDASTIDPTLMGYSSRGPVYRENASLTAKAPDRIKPDVTATSAVASYTKWRNDCDPNESVAQCGEALFFGGTSAGTATTGGLAALVTRLYKQIGHSFTADDVAQYLKDSARQLDSSETDPNNKWGEGFIELPCRPNVVSYPYESGTVNWSASDCTSHQRQKETGATRTYYADHYTFRVPTGRTADLFIVSPKDSYLYLLKGPHTGQKKWEAKDDDSRGSSDPTITHTLTPGIYTAVATTWGSGEIGSYNLTIWDNCDRTPRSSQSHCAITPAAFIDPDPSTVSFGDNGDWERFALTTNVPVRVFTNLTGETPRIEMSYSGTSDFCPPNRDDNLTMASSGAFYLAGCEATSGTASGSVTIEIRTVIGNHLLQTYTATVTSSTPLVCERISNLRVNRQTRTHTRITWNNPSHGLTATGRQIEVERYSGGAWLYVSTINEPAFSTSAWHIGGNVNYTYSYRIRSVCNSSYSSYSVWFTVGAYTGGASGAIGDEPLPEPTPTPPPGAQGASGPEPGAKRSGDRPPRP